MPGRKKAPPKKKRKRGREGEDTKKPSRRSLRIRQKTQSSDVPAGPPSDQKGPVESDKMTIDNGHFTCCICLDTCVRAMCTTCDCEALMCEKHVVRVRSCPFCRKDVTITGLYTIRPAKRIRRMMEESDIYTAEERKEIAAAKEEERKIREGRSALAPSTSSSSSSSAPVSSSSTPPGIHSFPMGSSGIISIRRRPLGVFRSSISGISNAMPQVISSTQLHSQDSPLPRSFAETLRMIGFM